MIDRKAFRISGIILLAVIAATLWRLSLLPDWRQIPNGPGAHHTVSSLFLFAAPASQLLAMVMMVLIHRLTSPEETLPAWRRWSGNWIAFWVVFIALMQAFVLARSLGLVSLSGKELARTIVVTIGIMSMIMGNIAPKAPSPSQGSLELNTWQHNRMLRFAGKLLFGIGLVFVLGGILLPLEFWKPVFLCVMLAALAASAWYQIKLRHERLLK